MSIYNQFEPLHFVRLSLKFVMCIEPHTDMLYIGTYSHLGMHTSRWRGGVYQEMV